MKRILQFLLFLVITQKAICQQSNLDQFNIERQKISKTGLKVLTAYSLANVLYGSIASSQSGSGSDKYFHKMNAIFNGITLGFVGIGFIMAKKEGNSYGSSLTQQANIEKLFLFNAGLDIAYFAGGAYMKERSKTSTTNASRQLGYGESIMLQGVVLFLFDGIMYSIHHHHGKNLIKMAENIRLTAANGIGVAVNF